MLGGIQSQLLFVHWDTELAKHLESDEEGAHVDHAPPKDDKDADHLAGEEHPPAIIEKTPVGSTAISLIDIIHLCEEAAEE